MTWWNYFHFNSFQLDKRNGEWVISSSLRGLREGDGKLCDEANRVFGDMGGETN